MTATKFWILSASLYSLIAISTDFESSMLNNVLIAYPLLIYCGWRLGESLRVERHLLNSLLNFKGVTGVLVASFTLAFWMIPNWMDLGASEPQIQPVKHACLFALVGLPLGASWSQSNFVIRGFVKIEFLSMLLRLGWIYMISPTRLCNIYSLGEQVMLGKALLSLAVILTLYYLYPLFVGQSGATAPHTNCVD